MDKAKKKELQLKIFEIIEENISVLNDGYSIDVMGTSRAADEIADWIENWLEGPKEVMESDKDSET